MIYPRFALIVFAALFFLKLEGVVSRFWIGSWYFAGIAALAAERAVLARIALSLAKSGRLARRAGVRPSCNRRRWQR